MNEAARPARADDLPQLSDLLAAAVAEAAALRGGRLLAAAAGGEDPAALRSFLAGYHETPGRVLLAGTIDDAVVGQAALRVAGDPPLGSFDVLYVEPEARGVGVGAALVDAGVDWLRREGAQGVDARTLPGSRSAKQFLEGAGFVARLIVMHRALD